MKFEIINKKSLCRQLILELLWESMYFKFRLHRRGMIEIYCNEDLITEIRNGNKEAEAEIVENNKALIYKIIKDYYYASKNPSDMEDVFQAGCLGLLKAVKNFKPEMGNKFVTYAYYLIRGEVQRLYEEHSKRDLVLSSINVTNSNGVLMESNEDILEYLRCGRHYGNDEWTCDEKVNNKLLVESLLERVTPVQKKILIHRYYDDLSQQEIGQLINQSQVYVSREEKRARKILMDYIGDKDCTY